jgi:hypothetical protein
VSPPPKPRSSHTAESSNITREGATAESIIQRLEDATPGSLFYCEADREEAVEIAREEITAVATGGTRG